MIKIINFGIIFFIISLVLFFLQKLIKNKQYTSTSILFICLFTLEHFIITFIFAFFLDKFPSINDPQRFFSNATNASNWLELFNFGNKSISFLIYPLVKIGFQIETLFFVFSYIGWRGFLILLKELDVYNLKKINIFFLFFLVPTIHLWTSSLSKEPILIFLIAFIVNELNKKRFNLFILISSSAFIFFIRPHVFFILFFCFIISKLFFMKGEIIFNMKTLINFTISLFSLFILQYLVIVYFLKIEIIDISNFENYYNVFIKENSNSGNAGISLIETNFFERIFMLLFMPLPLLYSSNNFFQYYVSIENIYYIVTFVYVILLIMNNRINFKKTNFEISFVLLSSIIMILFFGSYLYNLGLGNRMRIMFYPLLFYAFIKLNRKSICKE